MRKSVPSDDSAEAWPEVSRRSDMDADGAQEAADDADGVTEPSAMPTDERGGIAARRVIRAPRAARTWGRFADLWIPETLRDARVDPGRRGTWILLLVAAVAAVVTAVGVWRDRPEPVPITGTSTASLAGMAVATTDPAWAALSPGQKPAGSTVSAAPRTAGTGSGAADGAGPIIVSVTGLVGRPGIVRLPAGSRVADAIAAAGGPSGSADITGMNLAARLADGDSIVVGDAPATGGSSAAGTAAPSPATAPQGGLVDLNTADAAVLDALPGVGPVMAANILAWRQTNGRFASVEQLQEISGIGPARFAQISALVTVS